MTGEQPTVIRLVAVALIMATFASGIGIVVTPITYLLGYTPGYLTVLSVAGGIFGTWSLSHLPG